MNTLFKRSILAATLSASMFQLGYSPLANACTRALYVGADNLVLTGRTMDWMEDMSTDIWVLPRGIARNGEAGAESLNWTAKYGSVVSSIYGIASADGMNEKGLVMNLLYLAESNYGKPEASHPPMALSLWGQYALDNFATVDEAVKAMQAKPFFLIAPTLPNGEKGQAHLSLSDATGDSAIIEFIDGKQVIHHGKQYTVMTNSPAYDKQLALNEYWVEIGGAAFLPGTSRAADRFARTYSFLNALPKEINNAYIKSVPTHSFDAQGAAYVMSLMRAVSVPFGITAPNQPNIAATIWRSVSDQKNRVYYFDSSSRPDTFWIELDKLNFNKEAPVQKLSLANGEVYSGEVSKQFKPAKAFEFMPATH